MFEKGYYERVGIRLFDKLPKYRERYDSLCTNSQIAFLMGLIRERGMRNVLEIGTHNGVSALYMLKAGAEKLYALELKEGDFYGRAVLKEASKKELASFHLNSGRTSFDIGEIIPAGEKLDLVFIDGDHCHPYPLFDLIHIVPYLHDDSVVVLHDVIEHYDPSAWGGSFIFEGWTAGKYRQLSLDSKTDGTMGCIKIPKDKEALLENILRIAKLPIRADIWKTGENDKYLGFDEQHLERLKIFMEKHYGENFANRIYDALLKRYEEYMENWIFYVHETRFKDFLHKRAEKLAHSLNEFKMASENKPERPNGIIRNLFRPQKPKRRFIK
ncbi:MAG: class I SAM-dependent methyltransferase [Rickettsiales bacterium]|nr:class I SAM-dependent methyltransferase [Rickettsiales bacterium]